MALTKNIMQQKAGEEENFMVNNAGKLTLMAARSMLVAKSDEAYADLAVYLQNPAGIGEHANVTEEVLNKIKTIAEAEDALKTLDSIFRENYGEDKEPESE
jgi:hypothetical protein